MSSPSNDTPLAEGPLSGLRVIDWTHVLAGPFTGYQLGLLGAEVIRIERPDHDDMIRAKALDPDLAALGLGEAFIAQNAGKKSLAIDARDPRARQALEALIASADVLLENFRPGKLAALGFDPAELIQRHPGLVVCSITGFGPGSSRRAYDHVVQAASGLMAANADAAGVPRRIGFPVVDYAVGQQAALAVMAALLRRARTDPARRTRGEWLQVSMMGAALALLAPVYAGPLVSGREAPRSASTAFSGSPLSGTFPVGGGHLAIVCNSADQASGLMAALREAGTAPAHIDALAQAVQGQDVNRAQALLGDILRQDPGETWNARFERHGVPATLVASAAQAAQDAAACWPRVPLALENGTREVPVPGIGFQSTEPLTGPLAAPPRRGAHTRELLRRTGLDAPRIEALLRDGVVREPVA